MTGSLSYGRSACALDKVADATAIAGALTPVRLEFPILSLHPGLRQPCVAPDVGPTLSRACPSRTRCQAATGSWTKSRQWEIQRTLFSSARATVWPPAKVNGVWPSTTRGCVPRCRRPGSRQVSVQDHGHSRTAPSRDILAASCRSDAPRRGGTGAHEAWS